VCQGEANIGSVEECGKTLLVSVCLSVCVCV